MKTDTHYTIGIDPGINGGLAFMSKHDTTLYIMPTTTHDKNTGRSVDVKALYNLFNQFTIIHAYIERVQVRSQFAGMATVGINYGRILAMLEYLSIPYSQIPGNVWQKKAFGSKVTGRQNLKIESIRKALEAGLTVPTINLKGKVLSDGATDAYWIMVSQL